MMEHELPEEEKLYFNFRLGKKIPQNHLLRKLNKLLDLDFLYETLKDRYGYKGNVPVPRPHTDENDAAPDSLQRPLKTKTHDNYPSPAGLDMVSRL